jgi:DNA-binding FrmR family transcriptional regulator
MKTQEEIESLIEATKRMIKDAEDRDVLTQIHFYTGMLKAYENILMDKHPIELEILKEN